MNKLEYLVERWIRSKLFDDTTAINLLMLEKDGRKRNKVRRKLLESGYLRVDGQLHVTSKAFDEVKPVKPEMGLIWEKTLENWNNRPNKLNFVRYSDLNHSELAYVIANSSDYQFYLCIDNEINYIRNITQTKGPFSLEQIGSEYKIFNRELAYYESIMLMIGSESLKDYADEIIRQEKIRNIVAKNLAWGLVDQGIFESGENEIPQKDGDSSNVIYSSIKDGLIFNSFGNLGDVPESWMTNCEQSIEHCIQRINELNRQLTLLRKMKHGINSLEGGFDQFLKTMYEKVASSDI